MGLIALLELFLLSITFGILKASNLSRISSCPAKCGDVEVRYPFGIGAGCFLPGFELECLRNHLILPGQYTIPILDISQGEVRANSSRLLAIYCPAVMTSLNNILTINLQEDDPFTFSQSNKIIAVGCYTEAVTRGHELQKWASCSLQCKATSGMINGSCVGRGCCEIALPPLNKGIQLIIHSSSPRAEHTNLPCSYGFIAQDWRFNYTISKLPSKSLASSMSMKLEWAIGKSRCDRAKHSEGYACGGNSTCVDSPRGYGYLCKCLDGFRGNPYLNGSEGCQDVDECNDSLENVCAPEARCLNKIPGYVCQCPRGSGGNRLRGLGCNKRLLVLLASIASVLIILTTTSCVAWGCWSLKKKNQTRMFFQQNGGLLLSKHSNGTPAPYQTRLFSASELRKATDSYNKKRILGFGGQGTVYKGILNDGTVVAVKKSRDVDRQRIDQFINELVVLARIDHKNIVKLLGCCLETQVPLLVYEFIPNGTLQERLHECAESSNQLMPWEDRIRIANEVAEALSYLHRMPIFHRDVKSSNILLDENGSVKLADFGISKLVAVDRGRVSTAVRGTIGYLDPEYFKTGKLTEKSDVYSYGVVLLELLTCLKPTRRNQQLEDYSSLVVDFLSYEAEGNILGIFDKAMLRTVQLEEVQVLAGMASSCLTMNGEDRPTMKMISEELSRITGGTLKSENAK